MKINEVSEKCRITKRAIKYYEEKGLIHVKKDENGYRNYTEEHCKILNEISNYRKLSIEIHDIRELLTQPEKKKVLLQQIYQKKEATYHLQQEQLVFLQAMIEDKPQATPLAYPNIARELEEMIPGNYGAFFVSHFLPYLQSPLETKEQEEALQAILHFCDQVTIRIPLTIRFSYAIQRLFSKNTEQTTKYLDQQIQTMLHPTSEEYEKIKKDTLAVVKRKSSLMYRYHPVFISQRKFMKQLQDCGYNDIFIPNMRRLSPAYREYHQALTSLNQRICQDLGLYYDSNFNLKLR